jgi:DNA-binding transcriptional ArsR family regulator
MTGQIIHLDNTSEIELKSSLPNTAVCNKLTQLYSMFSDPTRLKIIVSLLYKEMCVNDLSEVLGINQTTISHQLKILKNNGAVSVNRKNKFMFYKVNNQIINNIMLSGIDYISRRPAV